jgi:hypothetical protein
MRKLGLLLSVLTLVGASTGARAIDFPVMLSSEEVECDRLQLEKLALRTVVSEVDPFDSEAHNPSLFLWRQASGGATFSGLAVTDSVQRRQGKPIRDERQLSTELVFGERGDLLDPQRPLLPNATLARRSQDTNLVVATREPWLTVTLEAAPHVDDPYLPKIPLVVNSLRVASGERQPLSAADAVGRSLFADGFTRPCHAKLTPFDERIFRILSRTLRISMWFTILGARPNDPTTWNIVLFRGEDPHLYRGTILGYQKVRNNDGTTTFFRFDPAGLEFEVQWDTRGKLMDGEIRLFPQSGTSMLSMFLLPPMRPGRDRQGEAIFAGKPFLRFDYVDAPDNVLSAPVNWEELLADSSWNQ